MAHFRIPLNSNFLTGIRDFRVPLPRFPLNSNFSAAFLPFSCPLDLSLGRSLGKRREGKWKRREDVGMIISTD